MKEVLEAARRLAEDLSQTSLVWDDPNGPYRCFVCSMPISQGHAEDCVKTQALSLLTQLDALSAHNARLEENERRRCKQHEEEHVGKGEYDPDCDYCTLPC